MTSLEPIQILVSHFDPIMQAGLVASLRSLGGVHVVTDRELDATDASGDILVADYTGGLSLVTGSENRLRARRVIIITDDDRECAVRHALRQGVCGYLLQGCTLDALSRAIRHAIAGRSCIDPVIGRRLAESLRSEPLTSREFDVLRSVAGGLGNKEIARHLKVSVHTVKSHLRTLYAKLDVSTRTSALAAASRRGLLQHADRLSCGERGGSSVRDPAPLAV